MIVLTATAAGPVYGTTRGTVRREAAKLLGAYFAGGSATGGSSVSLIDASLTTNGRLQSSVDAAERWKGGSLVMTGGTVANLGLWREISDDQPATGTLTLARALPASIAQGDSYEVYGLLNPDQWSDAIDTGLTRCQYLSRSPITLVPDGDMERTDVTQWAGYGAAVSKSLTDAVTFGAQSLLVTNTAANGYAQSLAIPVTPNTGWQLWVDYRCLLTSVCTAQVQIWDVTNNAAIQAWISPDADAGQNAQGGMMHVGFTIPANCMAIAVQIGGKETGAAIAFDDCVLVCNAQYRYSLPSWLTTREQYASLQERWGTRPLEYRWTDVPWPLNIEEDPTAVVTFRCDLPPNNLSRPVYLAGERAHGPMSSTADSATTACPLEWAKYEVAAAAHERYGVAIEQATVGRQRMDRADVEARVAQLRALYKPSRSNRVGFSKPWLGTTISVLP